ncbi:MAG: helix-turn-helix transcriptional regulator [Clostridia bacterium]|nr:helix-turn-helix transcriptional regulator [Clostridia bacterium]
MKITQVEFAEKINYSDKAVSKWERGESIPDVAVLKGIADFFGVTIDFMITKHDESEKIEQTTGYEKAVHNKNRVLISGITVIAVLICALTVFISVQTASPQYLHYNVISCFIFPLPIYFVLLLVFTSVWTRRRLWKIILVSLLIWSILLVTYSIIWMATSTSAYLVFIIGIPAQLVTLMSFGIINVKPLRFKKDDLTEEHNQE